jgi:phytoene dehydrogenase-like protein
LQETDDVRRGSHAGIGWSIKVRTDGYGADVDVSRSTPDALVIGSGPNGLVAANVLADRGWQVLVLEAEDHPGGAVWSSEMLEPGFVNDHCSAFYPLGAGSPVMRALDLESYGLRWKRSPLVIAHCDTDGRSSPALSMDMTESESFLGVDGAAWRALYGEWEAHGDQILQALFTPFPPLRAGARMAWSLRGKDMLRFARFAVLPVRRLGDERFESDGARKLLAGLALHADLLPESPLSGFFGWLLGALGQAVGFPVPEGGAGNLSKALVRRLQAKGGSIEYNKRVGSIEVRNGRAVGVRCVDGDVVDVRRAVLADVDAPSLYTRLLPSSTLDAGTRADIDKFQFDDATVKMDWALDGAIPWSVEHVRRAGTVHVGQDIDHLSIVASDLARGVVPAKPFMLMGQYSCLDSTRQPAGKETAWAYTHVPSRVKSDAAGRIKGDWGASDLEIFGARMEDEIEARAPGFKSLIRKRHILGPRQFEEGNSNLVHGALGGGTAQLYQQLIFRPVPGMGRPETPVKGVYLASASAHPGGGVHGACGANAARAAILHDRLRIRRR